MLERASDEVLVGAARAGDEEAFETLVRRHELSGYRVALRLLGSETQAEDATQEAFVQVWRGLSRFRGDAAFSTWFYRIVINRCLNLLVAGRPTERLDETFVDQGSDPAQVAERGERFGAVARAIQCLPSEQRAALVLREFEGLAYEEIAEVLEVTVAAVKGRIQRGRQGVVERVAAWG